MSNTLNRGKLESPKVRDLISKLSEFNPEMPIRIEDADTQWLIKIIYFDEYEGKILMSGKYNEMGDEDGRS